MQTRATVELMADLDGIPDRELLVITATMLERIDRKLDRLTAVADLFESLAGDDGEPLSLSKLLRMLVSAGKGG